MKKNNRIVEEATKLWKKQPNCGSIRIVEEATEMYEMYPNCERIVRIMEKASELLFNAECFIYFNVILFYPTLTMLHGLSGLNSKNSLKK